jgi:regulator of sigma E protease
MLLYGLFALVVLMIVHESGHFFAAKAFKMRVETFSIGFGPPIWKHTPKGSPTTYQIALIPLAYVRIAGMNPFEEVDPDDTGSYANASLVGRISAILAGPLANYFFASIVLFASLMIGGKVIETTKIVVTTQGAAKAAGLQDGDRILNIEGQPVGKWEQLQKIVSSSPGKKLAIEVERAQAKQTVYVTPRPLGKNGGGLIGVSPEPVPMPAGEALKASVVQPALIVSYTVKSLYRWILGLEKAQLTGPLGMMREAEKAAELGLAYYLSLLAFLSTSVGFFNMLPIPGLDGARLLFLGYEAVTRRQPNQRFEAQVHAVGILVLLAALALVSFREWGTDKTPSEQARESAKPPPAATK